MDKDSVELHLQTLFRNKNPKHTEALCAFFTHEPQDMLFPEEVETQKHGTWSLKDKGSDKIHYQYKTWALYERKLEGWDKDESILFHEGESGES